MLLRTHSNKGWAGGCGGRMGKGGEQKFADGLGTWV